MLSTFHDLEGTLYVVAEMQPKNPLVLLQNPHLAESVSSNLDNKIKIWMQIHLQTSVRQPKNNPLNVIFADVRDLGRMFGLVLVLLLWCSATMDVRASPCPPLFLYSTTFSGRRVRNAVWPWCRWRWFGVRTRRIHFGHRRWKEKLDQRSSHLAENVKLFKACSPLLVKFRLLQPWPQTFVSTESIDLVIPRVRPPSQRSVSNRWIPSKNSSDPAMFRQICNVQS